MVYASPLHQTLTNPLHHTRQASVDCWVFIIHLPALVRPQVDQDSRDLQIFGISSDSPPPGVHIHTLEVNSKELWVCLEWIYTTHGPNSCGFKNHPFVLTPTFRACAGQFLTWLLRTRNRLKLERWKNLRDLAMEGRKWSEMGSGHRSIRDSLLVKQS